MHPILYPLKVIYCNAYIYMAYAIYSMYYICNTLIYTILFDISESFKITLFKDQARKIIEAKVAENDFFCYFYFKMNSCQILSFFY